MAKRCSGTELKRVSFLSSYWGSVGNEGIYWGSIGKMEKKMETATLQRDTYIGFIDCEMLSWFPLLPSPKYYVLGALFIRAT